MRIVEVLFWPIVELLVWGFFSQFMQNVGADQDLAYLGAWLIGGMILWEVTFRAQQAVAISFLEDVWTRNLLNVFVAPVRAGEYVAAGCGVGVIRVGVTTAVLMVIAQVAYAFDLTALNVGLLPFFANLMLFGWALGMFSTALILRFGQAAETLAWAVPFMVQPFACVFYPISELPAWLQPISKALPIAHVFEGMRATLAGSPLPWGTLGLALALNLVYLAAAAAFYAFILKSVRQRGLLTKVTSH